MTKLRYRINGGSNVETTQTLPYNIPGTVVTDVVDVEVIGDTVNIGALLSLAEGTSSYVGTVAAGAFQITVGGVTYDLNTADILGQAPVILAGMTITDSNGGSVVAGDTLTGAYGAVVYDPTGGVPVITSRVFQGVTDVAAGPSRVVTSLDIASGLTIRQQAVNGYGTRTRDTQMLAPATFTPNLVTFSSTAQITSPNNLGADSDSILIFVAGRANAFTTNNRNILHLDSANTIQINTSGQLRILMTDPAGANAFTGIFSNNGMTAGDDFALLFAFHQGSTRAGVKRNSGSFVSQTFTVANTPKRLASTPSIGATKTPNNYYNGNGLRRLAVWRNVGSLIDVTTTTVQDNFFASDGTIKNPFLAQNAYGDAGSGKLLLDLYRDAANYITNDGTLTGLTIASGSLS